MTQLSESITTEQGISLVVYVHGWKHNAASDDTNVQNFRRALLGVHQVETINEKRLGTKARRVVGVYVAWRGKSLNIPEPLLSLTFWDRKFTAQHVSQGSVRELFSRLNSFQRSVNMKDLSCVKMLGRCKVRTMLIGHSFGGLILFNAISGNLIDSMTINDMEIENSIPRFGDMVILINPAFEASRYESLHRTAIMQKYRKYQAPIFVSVTSTADWATNLAFPIGRFFNTIFEHTSSQEESIANNNTIGHIPRYITHNLSLGEEENPNCAMWKDLDSVPPNNRQEQLKLNLELEADNDQSFFESKLKDGLLPDNWERIFCGGAILTHTQYQPNSPIWNIQTDKKIIPGHNEINNPIFTNFIRQLYHDTTIYPIH